ncbi:MAG: UPF0182 family protein [Symploca sp. SIO2B6]|nr:UPF0182 family protein [Symploca sp. SIO2B6]
MSRRFSTRIFQLFTLLLGLWLTWDLISHLVAEVFWFNEVGYLPAFLSRLQIQLSIWLVAFSISAGFLLGNLLLANRFKYPQQLPESLKTQLRTPLHRSKLLVSSQSMGVIDSKLPTGVKAIAQTTGKLPQPLAWRLRVLLPVVLLLCTLVGVMLLHYGRVTLDFWHPNLSVPDVTLNLPPLFNWFSAREFFLKQLPEQVWLLIPLVAMVIALIVNPHFWLNASALVLSFCWSLVLAGHWGRIFQYFYPTAFETDEPLFGHDLSFYVFKLPMWQLLDFWLGGVFLLALVAVMLTYLLSGDSLSQGKFPGFSQYQLRHLYGLGTAIALITAIHFWLLRFTLLYSPRGVTYGASYTDVNVQLPVNTGLSILAVAIAIFLLLRTIFWFRQVHTTGRAALLLWGVYLAVVVTTSVALPAAVQRFSVQPNELAREKPYIERSIALTKAAFDLDNIEVKTFNPEGRLTFNELTANELTIRNIRLWDKRPLLATNRQLQQIRPYYRFPDADIDRYTLKVKQGNSRDRGNEASQIPPSSTDTEKRQVIIAARELDYDAVPEEGKTWVNRHLIYTHGYGFTMSPVNQVSDGGLPYYFVKDIGVGTNASEEGALSTSSPEVRDSIPIGTPRIYYGEKTNTYVMTSTKVKELDYPSGSENVSNTYDGRGGISIGSMWRRLLFAQYLRDWQMLLTENFTSQSKLLLRRNIKQRLQAIIPFVYYDQDPYLVTADIGDANNHLYWIVDAYTTSDHYPYSDPGKGKFNYIRNSIKAVIDAYNGEVNFYIADAEDPIIKTWSKIFPNLFQPLADMPTALRSHIRYPVDLFNIQSEQLLNYHITDPQVFYNREDLWRIPQEIYGNESQPIAPYYLIMKLPAVSSEEFIVLQPYTPVARNNLIAWLAARCDGDQYGKLLLYEFPKQELVYGPEQIEALINQEPEISEQITLWNREGSRVIQGNLLVIPIERSLLYVEPLYLEAEQNSLPTLARVIVVYQNRIFMRRTLEESLRAIF